MSLSVEKLACQRSGRIIFSDFSFEIAKGEAVLLRGPNGVGKSTMLRVLAGLIPRLAGSATLFSANLDDRDGFQELINYAGHLDAIKPQLTVAENLRFWADLFGSTAFDGTMEAFSLLEIADRPAHTCSAGQKRRLGLARIAVADRPLWLLDEPTVSLDVETTATFARVIEAHCAKGGMALIATHIDLGLTNARELQMQPHSGKTRAADDALDPFLSGDWS